MIPAYTLDVDRHLKELWRRSHMSQGTVLVTGATGNTGGATVEELLARGRHVRALAHREDARSKRLQELEVEVVFGDFLDLDAIRAAVQGVQRAYFCYPIRPGIIQATAYFAQAAKEAGIDGVVNMSQVCARADAKSHAMCDHWVAERVFDWSGLTVAHLRPTLFAETLLVVAPSIPPGLCTASSGPRMRRDGRSSRSLRVAQGIPSSSSICGRSPSITRTVSLPARTTWSARSADASRRRSRSSSPSTVRPSPDN